MKFLDLIGKAQENILAQQQNIQKKMDDFQSALVNRTEGHSQKLSSAPSVVLTKQKPQKQEPKTKEKKHQNKKTHLAKRIINTFYFDYPEQPYISPERPKDWMERVSLFPNNIIPKSMMTRFKDGLLPGHIYMLYWLKKYTNKKVPSYFEYKYGIDFIKEKEFLYENAYLDNQDKPTKKGEDAIRRHQTVIKKHTQPKLTASQQILESRKNMLRNGFTQYQIVANKNCCDVCAELNGKHFPISELKIGVNAPPMHDGCMCAISAYEDREEYEAWLDFISKGGTTAQWEAMKGKRLDYE